MPAFFSARSTSGTSGSSASCTAAGAASTRASPCCRPTHVARPARLGALADLGKRLRPADHRLRHRLGQPLRLHQRLAAGGDLGCAVAAAEFSAMTVITSRPTTAGQHRPPRMRCCVATGRPPISGRLPATEAPASARVGRVRKVPPRSVGIASVMIDGSPPPPRCTSPASNASAPGRMDHCRALRAWLEPQSAFVERRILPRRNRIAHGAIALAPSLDPVQQTHRCLVLLAVRARSAQPTILRNASWRASSARRSSCQSRPVASRKRAAHEGRACLRCIWLGRPVDRRCAVRRDGRPAGRN